MRRPLIRTTRLLVEADGYCVVSDDVALVYGDGPTLDDAIRDYHVSLDELIEMEAAERRDDAEVRR